MTMKPCASCHKMTPSGELVTRCACGRETCTDCLIPTYDDGATGPDDVAGYICRACADDLVTSGHTEPDAAPWAKGD